MEYDTFYAGMIVRYVKSEMHRIINQHQNPGVMSLPLIIKVKELSPNTSKKEEWNNSGL